MKSLSALVLSAATDGTVSASTKGSRTEKVDAQKTSERKGSSNEAANEAIYIVARNARAIFKKLILESTDGQSDSELLVKFRTFVTTFQLQGGNLETADCMYR